MSAGKQLFYFPFIARDLFESLVIPLWLLCETCLEHY